MDNSTLFHHVGLRKIYMGIMFATNILFAFIDFFVHTICTPNKSILIC